MKEGILRVEDVYEGHVPLVPPHVLLQYVRGSWEHLGADSIIINIDRRMWCTICPNTRDNTMRVVLTIIRSQTQPMLAIQECERILCNCLRIPIKLRYVHGTAEYNFNEGVDGFHKLNHRL